MIKNYLMEMNYSLWVIDMTNMEISLLMNNRFFFYIKIIIQPAFTFNKA